MLKFLLLTFSSALLTATHGFASGSAPTRPARPPQRSESKESMDDAKYALGKAVFAGKAALVSNKPAAKLQRVRLEIVAARAGERGSKLPNLAGRLSEVQLDGLEYYVSKRFSGQ